jgi:hypothetical protein
MNQFFDSNIRDLFNTFKNCIETNELKFMQSLEKAMRLPA